MIQDCQNRPIGVTVSEWCQEHSITTSNYYYRMAQVRKACLDSLSNEVVEQAIVPIPMNVISSSHSSQKDAIPVLFESVNWMYFHESESSFHEHPLRQMHHHVLE